MATDVSIRLGVDGEKEFKSALAGVNSQIKNLNSEMKTVTSTFENAEDAEAAVEKRTDILARTAEATKKKISLLSTQYDKASEKLDELSNELDEAKRKFGENSEQAAKAQIAYNRQAKAVNDLGTQLNGATASLNRIESEMKSVADGSDRVTKALKKTAEESEDTGESLKEAFAAGAVAGGIQAIISSLAGLIDETAEYRKIMASLEVSSTKAGYTAQQTSENYKQLYSVLGDDQTAATALANLQALHLSQKDLTQMVDAAIGAWATYGDSIPIDGLAEAINETIKVGTVTGTFADVLNWAGTSEDDFNDKLAKCKTQTERVNLVTKELSKQGLAQAAESWRENNKDIISTNEASAELTETWAKLSKKVAPSIAGLKKKFAETLIGVSDFIDEHEVLADTLKTTTAVIIAFTAATKGAAAIEPFIAAIKAASTAMAGGESAVKALSAALSTNPYVMAAAAITTVTAAIGTLIYKNYQASKSLGEVGDAVRDNVAAWEEMSKTSAEAASENIAQIAQGEVYIKQLQAMTDANGKVKQSEAEKAEGLYSLISELLPGMVKKTGEGEKATYKFADSIDELIQKQKALAVYEAYKDDYTEAIKKKADATKKLTDLYAERNELEQKYLDALTNHDDAGIAYYGEMIAKNEEAIKKQLDLNSSYDQTISKVESLNEAISSKDWDAAATAINDFGLSVGNLKNLDSEAIKTEYEKVKGAISGLQSQLESGGLTESQRAQLEALLSQLQKFLPEYESAMNAAGNGGGQAYAAGIGSQQSSAAAAANKTASAVISAFTIVNESKSQGEATGSAYNEGVDSQRDNAIKAGKQNVQAMISGMESQKGSAVTMADLIAKAMNTSVAQAKNDFNITGGNLVAGLITGIKGKASEAITAARNLATKIKETIQGKEGFDTHSPSKWAIKIAGYVITGLTTGLTAGENAAAAAARKTASKIKDVMENELKNLNGEITKIEQEAEKKAADAELASYKKSLAEKNAELKKAAVNDKAKIQQEISKLESDWNEKQLKAQQAAEKEKLQAQIETLQELKKEYESALNEIESKEKNLSDKLKDYGELFAKVQGKTSESLTLNSLQQDIDTINKYGEAIDALKEKGAPETLITEVLSLDVDDAVKYISKLTQMTDEDYDEYIKLWSEKQQRAAEIAAKFYADEKDALTKKFVEKVPEELTTLKNDLYTIGRQSTTGLAQGMLSQAGYLYSTARGIIRQAISAMRNEADIHSPSRKTANKIGAPMAEGIVNKFAETMRKGQAAITEAMMTPINAVSKTDVYTAAASAVNGFSAVTPTYNGAQTIIIPVNLNGRQIAEIIYNPLKDIKKQRGDK